MAKKRTNSSHFKEGTKEKRNGTTTENHSNALQGIAKVSAVKKYREPQSFL